MHIQLLNRPISILNGTSNINTLFKSSRFLASEQWLVQVLVNAFGVEKSDAPFYLADNTGLGHQPEARSNNLPLHHRIFYLIYQSTHDGLSGARLEEMQRQLVNTAAAEVIKSEYKCDSWTEVPDVYSSFIQKLSFKASTTSLLGSRIFEVIPTLEADFWAFDSHVPNLFREMPWWLVPAAYKARDKMKANMKRWHAYANEHYDVDRDDDPRDWEEYFGTRLMRARQAIFRKMPLSKNSIAADDLGLLWG